jgi:hypothetical protein
MLFSSLLSLIFLLYLPLTYPILASSKLKGNQKCEYDRSLITKDLWLKGESAPVPFGSQLFAIYSWVPVSFILKSNLILGDLYTRKVLPQHTWSKGDGHGISGGSSNAATHSSPGMIMFPLSFSSFFDVKYFIDYWSQHKLRVITLQDYEVCFNNSSPNTSSSSSSTQIQTQQSTKQLTRIKRNPDFYPIPKSDYPRLLRASDIKVPIQENQTFIFDSPHKMIALYPFFEDMTMLQYVHTSLRPSLQISRVVKAILKELPSGFIAMHVRADSEALSADTLLQQINLTTTPQMSKQDRKKALVAHIMNSHCLQEIAKFDNAFIDPPAVYLATNTFHFHPSRRSRKQPSGGGSHTSTHTSSLGHHPSLTAANRTSTMSSEDRLKFLTSELAELGFHVIHTKTTLMEKLTMNLLEKSFEFKEIGDPTLIRRLLPEQLSYVDMLISRASTCFIPSHIPSTFSYLIQRMRNLDNKKYEKYEEVNNNTYGSLSMYRDWGM